MGFPNPSPTKRGRWATRARWGVRGAMRMRVGRRCESVLLRGVRRTFGDNGKEEGGYGGDTRRREGKVRGKMNGTS